MMASGVGCSDCRSSSCDESTGFSATRDPNSPFFLCKQSSSSRSDNPLISSLRTTRDLANLPCFFSD
ncbi:hypothetical protein AAC387_Pa01g1861 [Persea americana]